MENQVHQRCSYPLYDSSVTRHKLEFVLSKSDIRHIFRMHELIMSRKFVEYRAENIWRKARLVFEGKTYGARFKLHGRVPTGHYYDQLANSFSVKLKRGERILGYRKFKLYISSRLVMGFATMNAARQLGVITEEAIPVILRMNGKEYDYTFSPYIDEVWMEKKGLGSYVMLEESFDDPQRGEIEFRSFLFNEETAGWSEYRIEMHNDMLKEVLRKEELPGPLKQEILRRHRELSEHILYNRFHLAEEYFDALETAKFLFSRAVSGEDGHVGIYLNNRLFYDIASGRFHPVITHDARVDYVDYRSRELYGFPGLLGAWSHGILYHEFTMRIPLYQFWIQNDRIRLTMFSLLQDYLEKYPETELFKGLSSRVLNLYRFDPDGHARSIKSDLAKKDITATYTLAEGHTILQFRGNSLLPLTLKEIIFSEPIGQSLAGIEALNGRFILRLRDSTESHSERLRIDETYGTVELYSKFGLYGKDAPEDIRYTVRNLGINVLLEMRGNSGQLPSPLYVVVEWNKETFRIPVTQYTGEPLEPSGLTDVDTSSTAAFQAFGEETEDGFMFRAEEHEISDNLIFPRGLDVTIPAGTRFRIHPGRSIIIKGNLEIKGTADSPVIVVQALPGKPFGVIALIGKGREKASISHLKMSGPGEAYLEGCYLSGGLSIYHTAVVDIRDTTLESPNGEDGINVKYAKLCNISAVKVTDAFSDAIDIDSSNANVSNLDLSGGPVDTGGDGLDLSYSNVVVLDSSFRDFTDKGISAGEQAHVDISHCRFERNVMGFACKDDSAVQALNNVYVDNEIDVAVYNKKAHWGSGKVILDNPDIRIKADDEANVVWERDGKNDGN